jgi:hypothetical protein
MGMSVLKKNKQRTHSYKPTPHNPTHDHVVLPNCNDVVVQHLIRIPAVLHRNRAAPNGKKTETVGVAEFVRAGKTNYKRIHCVHSSGFANTTRAPGLLCRHVQTA